MSSAARKAERKTEFEQQLLAVEAETSRIASLSIFDRVNEATDIHDLKDIILTIAERAGMDIYS